jgi:hypothetical protein
MNDLHERLRAIEQVAPPDLWPDATTRSPGDAPSDRRTRLATAVLALALVLPAIWFAFHALSSVRHEKPAPAASGSSIAVVPPSPLVPASQGRIVFNGPDVTGGDEALFVVEPDGSGLIQLTGCLEPTCDPTKLPLKIGEDREPAWSPDGSTIVFSRWPITVFQGSHEGLAVVVGCDGPSDLFVMDADGSDVTQLTGLDEEREFTQQNTDTCLQAGFTPSAPPGLPHANPNWSADGTLIAFVIATGDAPGIYTTRPDGSGLQRWLDLPGGLGQGRWWSPDGTQIVFSEKDGVFVTAVDGSESHRVTTCPDPCSSVSDATWSPDGTRIAFIGMDFGDPTRPRAIYVVSADGTSLFKVFDCPTTSVHGCSGLAWSPDGTQLVFGLREDDAYPVASEGLYVVNVDGSGLARVTDGGPYGVAWTR